MSCEDNNNTSMMEMMKMMLTNMGNEINNNINNIKEDINSIKEDIISNNDLVNTRFESLQEKIASRTTSRANSRAVTPSALTARLNDDTVVSALEMPRIFAP